MDAGHFDQLIRKLFADSSRRGVLVGLTTSLLSLIAGLPLALGVDDAEAKKKKKRKNKNRRKKRKKNKAPTPPPPPPTGAGRCDLVNAQNFTGSRRFAQTLFPPQSGRLDAAQVVLASNPADFELTFEIFGVDAAGFPTGSPLATALANVAEATTLGDPPRTVSATFALPVPLVLGQQLALAVTGTQGEGFTIQANGGNPCPDGQMFFDLQADGNFSVSAAGDTDLVFFLTISD